MAVVFMSHPNLAMIMFMVLLIVKGFFSIKKWEDLNAIL